MPELEFLANQTAVVVVVVIFSQLAKFVFDKVLASWQDFNETQRIWAGKLTHTLDDLKTQNGRILAILERMDRLLPDES